MRLGRAAPILLLLTLVPPASAEVVNPAFGVWLQELDTSPEIRFRSYGASVAIDGDTAVVGDPAGDYQPGQPAPGQAFVFTRQGGLWELQQRLTAAVPINGDNFGESISAEGDTIVVGAPGSFNYAAGAAIVFVRTGTVWTQQEILRPSNVQTYDRFGASVELDGDTVLVGRWGDNQNGNGDLSGSAHVFVRQGTTWSEQAQLLPSLALPNRRFGITVALDGDRALVGECSQCTGTPGGANDNVGHVFVYERTGTTWSETSIITSPDVSTKSNSFGVGVALQGDTAVVLATGLRRVFVFEHAAGTWTQVASFSQSGNNLGKHAAIDGDTIVVSVPTRDIRPNFTTTGAVAVYHRNGTTWTELDELFASTPIPGLGASVAIDGCTVIAGAPVNSGLATAHVFELFDNATPGTPVCFGMSCPCGNDDPSAGCVNSSGAGSVLTAVGSTSVAADDLILIATNAPYLNTGLFIVGATQLAPIAVGDGLACTGGLFRYLPSVVTPTGDFALVRPIASAPSGMIFPGATRVFQAWTRDVICGLPGNPCPTPCNSGSNLSSAYSVTFTP